MSDLEGPVLAAMYHHFGKSIWHWPKMLRRRPSWWQFRLRRYDDRVRRVFQIICGYELRQEDRDAYFEQVRFGQYRDDACGYIWRCWRAALDV